MSYAFDMGFKSAENLGAAMEIAQQLVDTISKADVRNFIERNIIYIPSLRHHNAFSDSRAANIVDTYWLYSLLNFRFVYWPEYQILGLVGNVPKAKEAGFEMVMFQNSTDQDYGLDEWPENTPFFQARVNTTAQLLKEKPDTILNYLTERGVDLDDTGFDDLEEGAEYLVLTNLYDQIFSDLELDAWLYGRDPDTPGKFRRFALNAITTSEKNMDYGLILAKIRKEYV